MQTPLEIALKEYGKRGITGKGDSPDILRYFSEIGHNWVKDDDTAWCAAFANWVLKKAGRQHTSSLLARSFLAIGAPVEKPELGDLVVLWRVTKESGFGHVGFFINETPDSVFILGGNQTNQVNITEYSKEKLLGYRKIHA